MWTALKNVRANGALLSAVVYDWIRQQPMSADSDSQRFGVRQPNGARQPQDALYTMLAGL